MNEDVFTDEQLWDEVLEVLNDNRRELTDEEEAYYLEVMARINSKLLEVAN